MKIVMMVVGVLALVMGLVWMAQGSGLFPYPANSFMISQTPWIWRGSAVAVVGVLIILWARRRP